MPHEFTLTGADGAQHQYRVDLHMGREGLAIVSRLFELGAEPLARLATQALTAEGALDAVQSALRGDPGANDKIRASLSRLDFGAAAKDLRPLLADAPQLVTRILARTWRDNEQLSNETSFDRAYAGNYGELLQAVWKVVALNRFFPSPAT